VPSILPADRNSILRELAGSGLHDVRSRPWRRRRWPRRGWPWQWWFRWWLPRRRGLSVRQRELCPILAELQSQLRLRPQRVCAVDRRLAQLPGRSAAHPLAPLPGSASAALAPQTAPAPDDPGSFPCRLDGKADTGPRRVKAAQDERTIAGKLRLRLSEAAASPGRPLPHRFPLQARPAIVAILPRIAIFGHRNGIRIDVRKRPDLPLGIG
jgi:hypothetical protein